MWTAVVSSLPAGVYDDFKGTTLSAALDGDLDGYELVKAHATLAYGDLRPIDKVYIAMVQAATDEALLFEGLARCNPDTIEADFRAYEFRGIAFFDTALSIWDALDGELYGEDYRRALALVDREPNPEYGMFFGSSEKTRPLGGDQRLVALVRAAVHGLGTNFELIMTSIDEATQAERDALKREVENPADPLGLAGAWGDLGGGELARLRAKLGIAETAGDAAGHVDATQLADPKVQLLRGLGGVDTSTVYDTLKLSAGATWATFKSEMDKRGTFYDYVWNNTLMPEKAYVQTKIFNSSLDVRLDFCFGIITDDEDYLFHLLGNFTSNADRRRLVARRDVHGQAAGPPLELRGRALVHAAQAVGPDAAGERALDGAVRRARAQRLLRPVHVQRRRTRRTRTASCRRARSWRTSATRTSRPRSAGCSRRAARARRPRSRTTRPRATSSRTPRR